MTLLKAFNYSNINQRRALIINAFIASVLASFILINIFHSMQYYLFYINLTRFSFLAVFPGFVLGSLIGRVTFNAFKSSRPLCFLTDLFFVIVCAAYIGRFFITEGDALFLNSLIYWKYSTLVFSGILSFFFGIKTNYFVKVFSGDFIDEKHGLSGFVMSYMLGLFAGIIIASLQFSGLVSVENIVFVSILLAIALFALLSSFFINMPYRPETRYTQNFSDEEEPQSLLSVHRDDIFFTYLNVSYIFIYIYLGYISYVKYFGGFYKYSLLYFAFALFFMMLGFMLGRIIKQTFWHIYSEMLFPICFLLYVFLLHQLHAYLSEYTALLLLMPAGLLFGFTIYQTIKTVIDRFDQENRYNVLFFSIFIIPAPLLIALSFVEFSYFLYFFTLYTLTLLNIIFPGIYLLSRNAKNYQKYLFFGCALLIIPILLFMHLYLKLPLNSSLYISRVTNFDTLKNTNYDALYIKNKADVMLEDIIAFDLSHSVIRNMKRAIVPLFIYHPTDKTILIIDGNQKFFRQPGFAWFANADIIDTLPRRFVNYENLPLTGKRLYIADEKDIIDVFSGGKKYYTIFDCPNLLDLQLNKFRFSSTYYAQMKKQLTEGGIFAEILNLNYCSAPVIAQSVQNIKQQYAHQLVYRFTDIVLILASDDANIFMFNADMSKKIANTFTDKDDMRFFFYSEEHLLSNLLFNDISSISPFIKIDEPKTQELSNIDSAERREFDKFYTKTNNVVLSTLNTNNQALKTSLARAIERDNKILSLLKDAELAEAGERYIDEMQALFTVKGLAEYTTFLQTYIRTTLSYKKDYYYNAAMHFERKKDWETARKMYQAVLAIDKDNFDANYRLGILSLTVQDMESSFRYLQYALTLRKDDPQALTQMGILLFSTGRPQEAIGYFNQALEKRERNAKIFFYMGLSYEELGRLNEAKTSFERAAIEDPNDKTISSRREAINIRIQEERNKWNYASPKNEFDSEQGENFPLPIDKTSFDMRLPDDK